MLDVADVVDEDRVEGLETPQLFFEGEVALGDQEPLHQPIRRCEEHPEAALDQLVTDRAEGVRPTPARQPEGQEGGSWEARRRRSTRDFQSCPYLPSRTARAAIASMSPGATSLT